jgi:hypothetical protein
VNDLELLRLLEMLKVLHCTPMYQVKKLLGADEWPFPAEFEGIENAFRQSIFHGLCELDQEKYLTLMRYALTKIK